MRKARARSFHDWPSWCLAGLFLLIAATYIVFRFAPVVINGVNEVLGTEFPNGDTWFAGHAWLLGLALGVAVGASCWRGFSLYRVPSAARIKTKTAEWLRTCGLSEEQLQRLRVRVVRRVWARCAEVKVRRCEGGVSTKQIAMKCTSDISIVNGFEAIATYDRSSLTLFFRKTGDGKN